ncbi:MAG: phosphodiester glycosidase family protein [Verrucomicrobiota bacterium]
MPRPAHILLALTLYAWPHLSPAGELKTITFEDVSYRLYIANPAEIELHWKNPDTNQPYRTFQALQSALNKNGRNIELIMNAGIFDPGGVPSGLHIENSNQLRPINLKTGYGNFYLKPTGIFSISKNNTPAITETHRFAKKQIPPSDIKLALQSGPLLLDNGNIHPKFIANSSSKLHRNGVGIRASDNKIIFAITDFTPKTNRVNLHTFARLFKHLGCKDALFLDGDLSQMTVSPKKPIPPGNHLGALITITKPSSQ